MQLPKRKRPSTEHKLAKRHWENEGITPERIVKKYKVSISTAYRWIQEWESDSKN